MCTILFVANERSALFSLAAFISPLILYLFLNGASRSPSPSHVDSFKFTKSLNNKVGKWTIVSFFRLSYSLTLENQSFALFSFIQACLYNFRFFFFFFLLKRRYSWTRRRRPFRSLKSSSSKISPLLAVVWFTARVLMLSNWKDLSLHLLSSFHWKYTERERILFHTTTWTVGDKRRLINWPVLVFLSSSFVWRVSLLLYVI